MAAVAHRKHKEPNLLLERLIDQSGFGRAALARRVNQLAKLAGLSTAYDHTSTGNWTRRGMVPPAPVPSLIATALAEKLGRAVTPAEIGMGVPRLAPADIGLDYPRDASDAARVACEYWSTVDRRTLLSTGFSAAAYHTPFARWLIRPADATGARIGGPRVGRREVDELWQAADEARRWDSKYGGGSWRASSVLDCLQNRAAPLLAASYTEAVGRDLYAVTAELSRVAAWSALDVGHHDAAQRLFIQGLSLARAGGDVQLGSYILTTAALQVLLRGYPNEAVDMAQGAFERARKDAAPRVLAFTKLIEARAHARTGDARAAGSALAASEALLDQARPEQEPDWIGYFTHARLAADSTEIHRDLHNPKAALRWNAQAAMSAGDFTRSVGMRLAIVATAHLQAQELDQGLALGHQAVGILAHVESTRARGYVQDLVTALAPWQQETAVADFVHHARTELALAG
ncbi:sporulation protein [Kitasatospora kifunensis]|uniref:Sporulation associated protein n=1 Tax=Kitasatospora kifunensis TaxID=58351 RepID=A0A7W7RAA0_KITKI|nr:sporulation protein [Kitasatospora kifunensis]MBB4928281.1 hypothetical protein [Kitasatospora kifunensis]